MRVRAFYTPELHGVYTKRKHGYTIIDPSRSMIRLTNGGEAADAMLQHGFAVAHRTWSGRVMLSIVRSNGAELDALFSTIADALRVSFSLVNAWLGHLEHAHGRTTSLEGGTDQDDRRRLAAAARSWLSDGWPDLFSVDEYFQLVELTLVRGFQIDAGIPLPPGRRVTGGLAMGPGSGSGDLGPTRETPDEPEA